jgi:hypothetical protein
MGVVVADRPGVAVQLHATRKGALAPVDVDAQMPLMQSTVP